MILGLLIDLLVVIVFFFALGLFFYTQFLACRSSEKASIQYFSIFSLFLMLPFLLLFYSWIGSSSTGLGYFGETGSETYVNIVQIISLLVLALGLINLFFIPNTFKKNKICGLVSLIFSILIFTSVLVPFYGTTYNAFVNRELFKMKLEGIAPEQRLKYRENMWDWFEAKHEYKKAMGALEESLKDSLNEKGIYKLYQLVFNFSTDPKDWDFFTNKFKRWLGVNMDLDFKIMKELDINNPKSIKLLLIIEEKCDLEVKESNEADCLLKLTRFYDKQQMENKREEIILKLFTFTKILIENKDPDAASFYYDQLSQINCSQVCKTEIENFYTSYPPLKKVRKDYHPL